MLDLTPGTVLENRYHILRPLGQGGMGAVYLAQDGRLNQRCAVKMALHTGPDTEAQFRREAALLAGLHHPNLPRVTDYFTHDNRYFLVMDYVRGQNFGQIVRHNGPQPESRVLRWLPQILDALEYLHNQQPQPIIHRDVKPANLKLTPDGQVMLVDFGIAKRHDPQMRTITGAQAVSPGFSSPEQYGRGFTDARSDIYSLGATLYYLLTGVAPAEPLDRLSGTAELVPPRRYNPRISPASERAILKAMALNRNERFASVQGMRDALPEAEITTPASPLKQDSRLVPLLALLLVVLLAGAGAFGVWRFVSARFLDAPPGQTAQAAATAPATATETQPASADQPSPSPTTPPAVEPTATAEVPTRAPTATLRPLTGPGTGPTQEPTVIPQPPGLTVTPVPPPSEPIVTPLPEPEMTARFPRLVLGNYFAWYDADKWDDCNISAGDKPLQPYSSDDPATMARHIRMAMGVGLDGFTQHWFAPGERTDQNFSKLLAQSQGADFHSTIVFSRHIWHGSPAPTKQNVAEAIGYVIDTYSGHPNFLRLQGRPVIFFTDMYRVPTEGGQTPQQAWADIRAQVDPNGNTWWIAEGLDPSYLSVFDGLYVYKITHADYPNDYVKASRWANQVRQREQKTGKPKLWIATLSPGWDDTRAGCKPDVRAPSTPHKRDREDGAFYQATFDSAIDSNPDWLWIHSFNEWVEGTYIEPGVLYGDKYMQMTREFTQQFKP